MQKLYCYVDESGQDTQGRFFVVSVVVTGHERDEMTKELERIERESGKGRRKWSQSRDQQKRAYLEAVLRNSVMKGKLHYAIYRDPFINYFNATILTTGRAITVHATEEYKATVFIDGLQRSLVGKVGAELRRLSIRTEKVRPVRNEEASALMRLADALSGFVRETLLGHESYQRLLESAQERGVVREL
jgi:hypothetical protein